MKIKFYLVLSFLMVTVFAFAQNISVIPRPESIVVARGEFLFDKVAITCSDKSVMPEALFLKEKLSVAGVQVAVAKGKKSKTGILLQFAPGLGGVEDYRLEITPEQVVVKASGKAGIFYGIQTLLQMAEPKAGSLALPCGVITDSPRYAWRGYMLDESRHFFGKEKVKQLLDNMASYKLNKFHWHLTDEPGWRVEIKKYPKLATVGGKGNWSDPNCQDVHYYTQDEIKELVAYAAARHIEVIPEIDMPGHATAANMAYPEMSGGGTPEHPEFTFNVGKEEVYTFLTDVLKEVAALFPSPYLHIGGDEVSFGIKAWETDPHIQALIRREGMKNVKDAERYFMLRMADTVRSLGKTLVGWDELLDLNVSNSKTLIMWWRHDRVNQLKKSLSGGYATVMCPRRPLYFDFIQYGGHKWGRVWNGFCPLEDVYAFPDKGMASWQLPAGQLELIQGIQANVWTERIHTAERLDYMTYPRICALAESAWTKPEGKDFDSFGQRMEKHYRNFDKAGIYYFDHRNPAHHPEPAGPQQKKRETPMDFRD